MITGEFPLGTGGFDRFLMGPGLANHITFPTHERREMVYHVMSDFPGMKCPLPAAGSVGSLKNYAVFVHVKLNTERDDAVPSTIWLRERAEGNTK